MKYERKLTMKKTPKSFLFNNFLLGRCRNTFDHFEFLYTWPHKPLTKDRIKAD